ncbi:TPA_asm: cation:dicarboxylase symporter family transporter [Salmonella enterica]|uniref:Cation:dicarboxylase symporter family transporter n=6 Tax=Salmonella enterica TaxID=28901 RepID=A0A703ZBW5_SALER|nr:cation:dicarboxylase symporter family transporter [Salmonella enterica]
MKNLKVSLAWQILLAMVLGILLGSYLHYHSDSREWLIANLLSPAGDIFIHLIKMIVVPIVISTLIVGIAGVGDAKQLGRIGAKTILYFELITTVAIILGITLANVFQPGSGIDMSQLATVDISKYQNTTAEVQSHAHGLMGTILSLVPTNIIASMAKGDMLPIIFFSVLFGLGVIVGTFHVGQPLRALNMLLRVGHSPMSNEIVLSAAFAALGGLGALGLLLNRATPLCNALVWLAAIVGVVFLYAVPQIYQLPTVATWRSSYTTAMMILTPLIGGGALAALFGVRRLGLLVSVLAILVSFCLRPGYMATLMSADSALTAAQHSWFTAQAILLAAGVVGVVVCARLKSSAAVLAMTAVVVIAAELAGRIAFYNLWTLPM